MSIFKKIIVFVALLAISLNIYTARSVQAANESETEFAARIADYEKEFPTSLTTDEAQLVASKCLAVQKKIIEARDTVSATVIDRENSYGNIERKLAAVQSRLSGQGLDTSVIDLILASYRIEVSNFKTSADRYSASLNDASAIDCQKQPSAFKSTLLAVRYNRQLPVNSMKRIRDLYNSTFMTSFDLIGKQLNEK